ncbi:unnamed protein product [Acanthoscelides obtectus]|uniref:Uncharacterized protein n=1 Tax=Acanthoscelides obtectus TaxID=200917 RepID=A0A9P0LLM5_ACAOB|nr:unnamed protein product [Acanthoscelides obtectus]CAK1681801.1 hypothetical protein AOBTE_LOCUS33282 [Acanthoscelides obtectus]
MSSTESIGTLANRFLNIVKDINNLDKEFGQLKFSECSSSLGEIQFWKNISNIKKGMIVSHTQSLPILFKFYLHCHIRVEAQV